MTKLEEINFLITIMPSLITLGIFVYKGAQYEAKLKYALERLEMLINKNSIDINGLGKDVRREVAQKDYYLWKEIGQIVSFLHDKMEYRHTSLSNFNDTPSNDKNNQY